MNALDRVTDQYALAWQRLNANPAADFMVMPEMVMQRGDLAGLVSRLVARLEAEGVREGDRVLIRTGDEACATVCVIACLLDGLVPVMLSPETPDDRAAHILGLTGAALAVLDSPLDGARALMVADAAPGRRGLRLRKPSAQELIAARLGLAEAARAPRLPDDPRGLAYIVFTSGTTSDPAGVMISRGALAANLGTIASVLEIDEGARIFNDMILAHADGLVQGPLMALMTGGAVIRAGGFAVDRIEPWLNRVRATRATHFITVPTVWTLIDRYATHDDYFDAPELRFLGTVAAAIPQALWQRIEERFKRPLINQYGLTETVASALFAGKAREAGARFTVGLPVGCEARIDGADESGAGELMLRGANIFDGYWKNPERTAATLTREGWLHSGDLARRRDDGSYEILGRIKTAIMSAGFLIRPEEVDDVLTRHPQVNEAVTVGLPHPEFGEIAVSGIVCDADGPGDEEIRAFARTLLEPLKLPKRIVRLDRIPRGDAGKPRLDAVRTLLNAQPDAPAPDTGGDDVEARLIELAAGVFYVSPGDLSLASDPDTVEGWDSFTHIALILALEEGFGVRITPGRAAALRSLGDAAIAVREARE